VFETLISPFKDMEDYQPMHHKDYLEVLDFNEEGEEYLETLFTNQIKHCSRFINQTVSEAGVCKNDIIELNNLGLV
jgi:hypothetical protein|tara:strand:+ start:11931 stop:12158 length:228 start_codon:yes stop_codon:yes gene_type:complete